MFNGFEGFDFDSLLKEGNKAEPVKQEPGGFATQDWGESLENFFNAEPKKEAEKKALKETVKKKKEEKKDHKKGSFTKTVPIK